MHHDSCRQLLARALPGRAAAVLGQAAIAAGIITAGGASSAASCWGQRGNAAAGGAPGKAWLMQEWLGHANIWTIRMYYKLRK